MIFFMVDKNIVLFNDNFIYGKQRRKISPPNRNLKGHFVLFFIIFCKIKVAVTLARKYFKTT